jgi:hypothetical protein
MAATEKTPAQLYQAAYAARKRAAAKPILDAAAEAWPLERPANGRGWKWTTCY